MNNSQKEIYISNMNFINPEFNIKNKSRNIKTRDIYTSKLEHINYIS